MAASHATRAKRGTAMADSRLDPSLVAEWVRASCEAQGVPLQISDRGVVRQVSVLLGAGDPAQSKRKSGRARGRERDAGDPACGDAPAAPTIPGQGSAERCKTTGPIGRVITPVSQTHREPR